MSRKMLFIDESGDHALHVIDSDYPVFVLAGVIIDTKDIGAVHREVRTFKREFFGSDEVVLHTSEIIRQRGEFAVLVDPALRQAFFDGLNELMKRLPYKVVACAILKYAHRERYGANAFDPYELGLHVLVERFCFEGGGSITAEARDEALDARLGAAWKALRESGSYFVPAPRIRAAVSGMTLIRKEKNVIGLQLADLVASPIGRFTIGKRTRPDWTIVEGKMRRGDEGYLGHGLVILPKE